MRELERQRERPARCPAAATRAARSTSVRDSSGRPLIRLANAIRATRLPLARPPLGGETLAGLSSTRQRIVVGAGVGQRARRLAEQRQPPLVAFARRQQPGRRQQPAARGLGRAGGGVASRPARAARSPARRRRRPSSRRDARARRPGRAPPPGPRPRGRGPRSSTPAGSRRTRRGARSGGGSGSAAAPRSVG